MRKEGATKSRSVPRSRGAAPGETSALEVRGGRDSCSGGRAAAARASWDRFSCCCMKSTRERARPTLPENSSSWLRTSLASCSLLRVRRRPAGPRLGGAGRVALVATHAQGRQDAAAPGPCAAPRAAGGARPGRLHPQCGVGCTAAALGGRLAPSAAYPRASRLRVDEDQLAALRHLAEVHMARRIEHVHCGRRTRATCDAREHAALPPPLGVEAAGAETGAPLNSSTFAFILAVGAVRERRSAPREGRGEVRAARGGEGGAASARASPARRTRPRGEHAACCGP